MKSHTDSITIGRDPVLTYQILNAINKRRDLEQARHDRWVKIKRLFTFKKS